VPNQMLHVAVNRVQLAKKLELFESLKEATDVSPWAQYFLLRHVEGQARVEICRTSIEKDVEWKAVIESVPGRPGAVLLPVSLVRDYAQKLTDQHIVFCQTSDDMVCIQTERGEASIEAKDARLYPAATDDPKLAFTIPAAMFDALIQRTQYAIDKNDQSSRLLNCVLLRITAEHICMVGCDGFRLAVAKMAIEGSGTADILVPKKHLLAAARLASSEPGDVSVSTGEGFVYIKAGSTELRIPRIVGEYPNYNAVLPKHLGQKGTCVLKEFEAALKRMAVFGGGTVSLTLSGKYMILDASSSERGSSREQIAVKYEGKEVQNSFNLHLVSDFIPAFKSSVRVNVIAHEHGWEFSNAEMHAPIQTRYIVMPVGRR